MKNLLFVSIAFPPKNDPESLQTAKYFKYLVKNEIEIDVVTSKLPTLWMDSDESLKKYAEGAGQIIEIPIFEPKYLSIFVGKYAKFLKRPDTRMSFFRQWKKVVKNLKEKPDVLYSRSFPLSSTMMAYYLKKHYEIPWILHLSDPWADSPLFNYKSFDYKYHDKWERKCFEGASKISLTSSHSIKHYKEKYPQYEDKFVFFPNVYDEEDISDQTHEKNDKMQFLYTGSLNGTRSVKYLVEAVKIIEKNNPEVLKEIEFIFAGALDSENAEYFEKSEHIKHIGFLSFEDVKKMQQQADILLLIDFLIKKDEDAVFFPSKILDYLITRKPILAITTKNSMTYEVINGRYGKCYSHEDHEDLAKQILEYFEMWKSNELKIDSSQEIDKTFSAKENAERLYKIINNL